MLPFQPKDLAAGRIFQTKPAGEYFWEKSASADRSRKHMLSTLDFSLCREYTLDATLEFRVADSVVTEQSACSVENGSLPERSNRKGEPLACRCLQIKRLLPGHRKS
jgi:hypothetical protein